MKFNHHLKMSLDKLLLGVNFGRAREDGVHTPLDVLTDEQFVSPIKHAPKAPVPRNINPNHAAQLF